MKQGLGPDPELFWRAKLNVFVPTNIQGADQRNGLRALGQGSIRRGLAERPRCFSEQEPDGVVWEADPVHTRTQVPEAWGLAEQMVWADPALFQKSQQLRRLKIIKVGSCLNDILTSHVPSRWAKTWMGSQDLPHPHAGGDSLSQLLT